MNNLHFSMTFSGTVSPNGGDESANTIAMTEHELRHTLYSAISHITGEGLVTGDTPATLGEHSTAVRVSTVATEMMALPVISTAHLDAKTARWLTDSAEDCDWATVAPYAEGFYIHFNEQCPESQVPACAKHIAAWLKAQGFSGWVRLDSDADEVEGLPAYDW
ncbi:MAG: hypothetical protein KAI85_16970 [Halopseudomonas aestusnigri]|nr:hypothetical protein [Halopseudomonas aestusnigri]